jgi:hypothetical protein
MNLQLIILILSRVLVTIRLGLNWMIGFIATLYTPLGTTANYSAIVISTFCSSLLHTTSVLSLLHSPLAVSWQRIHKSLTVTSNYT